MKSNKNNILINEKNEQKENIENNININNDINNNDFSNIKILKEYESNPNKDILKYSEKNQSKAKYTETIEVIYEEIPYKLNISLKFDNNIYIELISKEGHIPYSYRAILDEKKFHKLNSIFEEINSIQKIYNIIIIFIFIFYQIQFYIFFLYFIIYFFFIKFIFYKFSFS